MNYYEMLRVERGATADQIQQAFRTIAKKTHPDRNPGNKKAERVFKLCAEAYETLSDPERRKAYDRTLGAAEEGVASCKECGAPVANMTKTLCARCALIVRMRKRAPDEARQVTPESYTSRAKDYEQPMPNADSSSLLEALYVESSVRQAFEGTRQDGQKSVVEVDQGGTKIKVEIDAKSLNALHRNLKTGYRLFKMVRDILS